MRRLLFGFGSFGVALFPWAASAHEVYVLSPQQIALGRTLPPFSEWSTMSINMNQFVVWGFIAALVVFLVFFVSISRTLEAWLSPALSKLPPYAPTISRVTVGLSLLAAAYYGALFGPELPLNSTYGGLGLAVRGLLVAIGLMITFGWYARVAALVLVVLFCVDVSMYGTYMLTYANYLGEALVLLFMGILLTHKKARHVFPLLRVAFGVSLIYSSVYAKILHNNLALQVASLSLAGHPYSIAHYLGFEPHFLVLGAAIIEIIIGLFFICGVEIRFASLFVLFWLSLSLGYFGEVVWPHIILIGIPVAFICYGYDGYCLQKWFFRKNGREPVL